MRILLSSRSVVVCLGILLLAACEPASTATPVAVSPPATSTVTASAIPTLTPTPLPTATPTPTPTQTATQVPPSPTPIPWASIDLPDGTPQEQADYLFGELAGNDYGDLASQLRQLPEIADGIDGADVEALADITALAVNASNPEVKEAYELMVSGGRGSALVSYGPWWNTQLQVLYHLAQQNEFRDNDTLAQAIAMSNGLWVAMGDQEVDEAVFGDVNEFLEFQRQHNPHVEDYPLEALAALAWRGNYSAIGGRWNHLANNFAHRPVDIFTYEWNTVSVDGLKEMRGLMEGAGWLRDSAGDTIAAIEYYFYFDGGSGAAGDSTHWRYNSGDEEIVVDDRKTVNHDMGNADFSLETYKETGRVIGDCGDESTWIDALLKSVGISSNITFRQTWPEDKGLLSHFYAIYFDPESDSWKAYQRQLSVQRDSPYEWYLYIIKPPADHRRYLMWNLVDTPTKHTEGGSVHILPSMTIPQIRSMYTRGIPSQDMKRMMLY